MFDASATRTNGALSSLRDQVILAFTVRFDFWLIPRRADYAVAQDGLDYSHQAAHGTTAPVPRDGRAFRLKAKRMD